MDDGSHQTANKLQEILLRCGYIGIIYIWNAFPPDEPEAFVLRDKLTIKEQMDKDIGVDFMDISKPVSNLPHPNK